MSISPKPTIIPSETATTVIGLTDIQRPDSGFDNNITCAEVVAIVDRATQREPDTEYVNLTRLNYFSNLNETGYLPYYPIIGTANTHNLVKSADGETFVNKTFQVTSILQKS